MNSEEEEQQCLLQAQEDEHRVTQRFECKLYINL